MPIRPTRHSLLVLATTLTLLWVISTAQAASPRVFPKGELPDDARLKPQKDLNAYFPFKVPKTREAWESRKRELKQRILVSTGLWPMPQRTPLNPVIFGKVTPLPRLTAWYGDEGAGYEYSGIRNEPLEWTAELARLRDEAGEAAGVSFNSVLLNLYRDGSDSVSWHSDDEPELGQDPTIASVSLGATRRFKLRHKATRETVVRDLEDGSLLLMSGNSQRLWEHCITKTRRPVGKRINLTFRVVGTEVQGSPGVRLG